MHEGGESRAEGDKCEKLGCLRRRDIRRVRVVNVGDHTCLQSTLEGGCIPILYVSC